MQQSRSLITHITHLEETCSRLALDRFEDVLQDEQSQLHQSQTRLEDIQNQRHQLMLEYKTLLRNTPECLSICDHIHNVTLPRVNGTFGFTVVGGRNASVPPMVVKLLGNSAAEQTGLRVGDELLSVNGQKLGILLHEQVIECIRDAGDQITLKFSRSQTTG